MKSELIYPEWPQPDPVGACSTTRQGGVSLPPFESLNLGDHVGDSVQSVTSNRQRIGKLAGLPADPYWLEQVHGTEVVRLESHTPRGVTLRADASYTDQLGVVCAVANADCLPVLFCSKTGDEVAAAHAGWRGLNAGVLENTLSVFRAKPADIMAWFGPAIGPQHFKVGPEVRQAFMSSDARAAAAFAPAGEKFMADIYQLARLRLQAAGVSQIYGGSHCTVSNAERFFSYRRDGVTGRLASLIWRINPIN